MAEDYDLIIIGGGPAGMTAGIYAARQQLKALIFEAKAPGGQLLITTEIENYPGFGSVTGPELSKKMEEQTKKAGAIIKNEQVTEIKKGKNFEIYTSSGKKYTATTVILATGAEHRHLGIPGEDKLIGRGVSYCATCDAPFFKGKTVVVMGAGNAALRAAFLLEKIVKKVYLVHRRKVFRADTVLIDKLKKSSVEIILDTVGTEIVGEKKVEKIKLKNKVTEEESEIKCDGIFIQVGTIPVTKVAEKIGAELRDGFLKVDENMQTSVEGLFAAGDVLGGIRQIASAVGYGATAALSAFKYIEEQTGKKLKTVDWH